MKDWDDYRFLLALDRYGTISLAAENLGVSTVTVSRHIDNLTAEVGKPLFSYRNGRWEATGLGRSLSKIALAVESEDARGKNIIAGHDEVLRGNVRINSVSFINNFFLTKKLNLLREKHSNIVPVLEASEKTVSLSKGETEISVRLFEPREARLIRAPMCKFPVGLFKTDRGDDTEWVGLPEGLDWLPEMKMAYEYFGKPPQIRVDNYPGIANAARTAGIVGLLPTCISSRFSGILPLAAETHILVRDAWCVYHEINRGNHNIAAVVEWIKDVLGNPRECACGKCGVGVN